MPKPLPPEDRDDSVTTPTLADGDPFHVLDGLDEQDVADMRAAYHRLAAEAGRSSQLTPTRLESLGPFRDLVEIGRGGMGMVYQALDPGSGVNVAVKVPTPELKDDPAARRRFLREVQAAQRLHHPGIVPYRGSGEDEGRCYIVSDLCEGPNLETWLKARRSPVPAREAARIVRELADAIAHAHEQGVLHRDVKPSNVLLPGVRTTSDAEEVRPRLTDFGLARAVDPHAHGGDTATATGLILGSPPYMAPEQAAGRGGDVDRRTDVYGLGAVLYALLTFRPPFRGETPVETMRMVVEDDPIPIRVLRPGAPKALETITLKCLEKSRDARYATAEDLRDDLDAYLKDQPIKAIAIGPVERLRRWSRRKPRAMAAVATGLTALAVLIALIAAWNLGLHRHLAELRRERDLNARLGYAAEIESAQRDYEQGRLGVAQPKLVGLIPREGETDLREFAWRHLWMTTRNEAKLLSGCVHGLSLPSMSLDDRLMATINDSTSLEIYNLQLDRVLWSVRRPSQVLGNRPAFSPNGRLVAACRFESDSAHSATAVHVEVRDVHDGHVVGSRVLPVGSWFQACRFLDDERLVLAIKGGAPKDDAAVDVSIWSARDPLPDARPVVRLAGCLAVSADGRRYAAIGPKGRPAVYDVDQSWLIDLPAAATDLQRVDFDEAGKRVALVDKQGMIRILETDGGRLLLQTTCVGSPVEAVVFHPRDPALLVRRAMQEVQLVSSRSDEVQIFGPTVEPGVATRQMQFSRDGTVFFIHRSEFMAADHVEVHSSVDGRRLGESPGRMYAKTSEWVESRGGRREIVYATGRHVWRWDWRATIAPRVDDALIAHQGEAWSIAYSPDGKYFATGADDDGGGQSTIKLWEVGTKNSIRSWPDLNSTVADLAFSPDGRLIATAHLGQDQAVRVREAAGGDPIQFELPGKQWARSVDFDPSGEVVIAGGEQGDLVAWNLRSRKVFWSVRLGTAVAIAKNELRIHDLAVDAGTARLASASDDGSVRLQDLTTGAVFFHYLAPASVYSIAFSPDGRTLAAADRDGSIHFLDTSTGGLIRIVSGDDTELRAIAFSPDGRTLAAGGLGKVVHLWDPETSHELLTLHGAAAQINCLAFSPDGGALAAVDHSGMVRFWNGPHVDP